MGAVQSTDQESVRDVLEYMNQLHNDYGSAAKKVTEELKKKVDAYCKSTDDKGYYFGNGSFGYFRKALHDSFDVRFQMLSNYNHYKKYKQHFKDEDTEVEKHANYLSEKLFSLYGTLFYMYFQCSHHCQKFQGGKWEENPMNEVGSMVNTWLTGNDVYHAKRFVHILPRGFMTPDLSDITGKVLASKDRASLCDLIKYSGRGNLQHALFWMLFLGPWVDGKTGHAILFLRQFIDLTEGDYFSDKSKNKYDYKRLISSCRALKTPLGDVSRKVVPVGKNPNVKYSDLLSGEFFDAYVDWLEKHLDDLIKSLDLMGKDCHYWTYDNLKNAVSYGPFPWGCVFKDEDWEKSGRLPGLTDDVKKANEALSNLKKAIDAMKKGETVKVEEQVEVVKQETETEEQEEEEGEEEDEE